MREQLIAAVKAHAQGEIAKHRANVNVYLEHPAGIGQNSDITEAIQVELDKIARYHDQVEVIEKYFKSQVMATITTDDIETYLEGLGKHDSKGKVHFERVLFSIKTLKSGVKIVLDSPDTEPVLKNFKSKMIKTLMGQFKNGALTKVEEKVQGINKGIDNPVIRLRYSDNGQKHIDFDVKEYPAGGKTGTVKPAISEPATMLILTAALESRGKDFKSEEDIFVHDVYKKLEKLFAKGNVDYKLDSWIYTFLTQNKLFFENYSDVKWAPFKHNKYKGQRDMQVFFSDHLKTLTTAPGIKVGRTYEQWNPADLWAVKRTQQKTLEKEITEATKNPSADNLIKLNTHIVKLMEKKNWLEYHLKKLSLVVLIKYSMLIHQNI